MLGRLRHGQDGVERSRAQVLVQVNQALVLTYWYFGKTIKQIRQELSQLGQGASASPALFLRDPCLLDFLDLKGGFTEKDLQPDGIHVAEYWLQLPPQEVLRAKLHKALVEARARLERTPEVESDE